MTRSGCAVHTKGLGSALVSARKRLITVEAETPVGKIIHVVLDNYATHKHPKVD
jgi:hypothetical protein